MEGRRESVKAKILAENKVCTFVPSWQKNQRKSGQKVTKYEEK